MCIHVCIHMHMSINWLKHFSGDPTLAAAVFRNKKNYVFNEAASKDYVCINQGTKPWLFLIISDHSRPFPTTFDHFRPLLTTPYHLRPCPTTIFYNYPLLTIFEHFRPLPTDRPIDRPTDRQTARQTHRQTIRQTDRHTD